MNEYTVTIAGPQRRDGHAPWVYLVDADTPEDAANVAMRVHLTNEEDNPHFDPATPLHDGSPAYIVRNVEEGASDPDAYDIRGVSRDHDQGETILVEWEVTTKTQYQTRLPVATANRILASLGHDQATTTQLVSLYGYTPELLDALRAREWPSLVTREWVEDRAVNIYLDPAEPTPGKPDPAADPDAGPFAWTSRMA
jgi:hypothetical protein